MADTAAEVLIGTIIEWGVDTVSMKMNTVIKIVSAGSAGCQPAPRQGLAKTRVTRLANQVEL